MSARPGQNGRLALMLLGIVATMVSLSFAAVPFYSWFCRVTGFAGTPQTAATSTGEILDQTITVRFDANTGDGMPWEFKPVVNQMEVRIGEQGMAFYEAYNPTDRVIAGTASYNVAPDIAGAYFTKIQCFCFTEQVLKPHERVQMPVVFFVDPEITRDTDTMQVKHITLSYTFFETELPDAQASLSPGAKAPYN
ncbi:cytochrome c oxidase assembly protein [Frigidibacter sp. SD6-1]|uniref:cytochrome c oxidase assembly protein n=1 Tax=Frigidibacter sp. SD6-1 TaxID=3032581 RepID=UPI0024DFA71D|nr:cytochrome c oxidase assembly protein [Frigidibacter sp. SD6-1]